MSLILVLESVLLLLGVAVVTEKLSAVKIFPGEPPHRLIVICGGAGRRGKLTTMVMMKMFSLWGIEMVWGQWGVILIFAPVRLTVLVM